MTGGVGRESSVCTGANSTAPDSVMRLLFDVCQLAVFRPAVSMRDSVARTPTVTTRSAIATKTVPPIAVARDFPRRVAHRAFLSKLSTSNGIRPRTIRVAILHQLPVDCKNNCQEGPKVGRRRQSTRSWEAEPRNRVAWEKEFVYVAETSLNSRSFETLGQRWEPGAREAAFLASQLFAPERVIIEVTGAQRR